MNKPKNDAGGRFAYELDRVLHEKARLGIMTSLAVHPAGLRFTELKELCALTDGNLSRHLQVLEAAGLLTVTKGFAGRIPQTTVKLAARGRREFLKYLAELERVIADAAPEPAPRPALMRSALRPAT